MIRCDKSGMWLNVADRFDVAYWWPTWVRKHIGPEPRRHLYHIRKRMTPLGVLRLRVGHRYIVGQL